LGAGGREATRSKVKSAAMIVFTTYNDICPRTLACHFRFSIHELSVGDYGKAENLESVPGEIRETFGFRSVVSPHPLLYLRDSPDGGARPAAD